MAEGQPSSNELESHKASIYSISGRVKVPLLIDPSFRGIKLPGYTLGRLTIMS